MMVYTDLLYNSKFTINRHMRYPEKWEVILIMFKKTESLETRAGNGINKERLKTRTSNGMNT